MIKVDKDFTQIPPSLNSDLTSKKRREIIDQGKYPSEARYNDAYKQPDIKEALLEIYHGKCCYCEKNIADRDYTIEHYRPKSVYFWLAYSWDNLLLCCSQCNRLKRANFELDGKKRAGFLAKDLDRIHALTSEYQALELPKMIHPELEDVRDKLLFTKTGAIRSSDPRVHYTIKTCEIDRTTANDKRREILHELINQYKDRSYQYKTKGRDNRKKQIRILLNDFKAHSEDSKREYLAFRQCVVKHIKFFLSYD